MAELSTRLIVGLLASAFLVSLLLTPTSYVTARGVSFIDTELKQATEHKQYVQVNLELSDKENLLKLPTTLGEWDMVREHDWDHISSILNSDVLLAREYAKPGIYQPFTLVIVESKNLSSFHPAPVCFTFQGYTILEEGSGVRVPTLGSPWAREAWLSQSQSGIFQGEVGAKKLIASREGKYNFTEHTLATYFYIKREGFQGPGDVTWVRVSVPIPSPDNHEGHLRLAQELLGEVVPLLFTIQPPDETLLGAANTAGGPALAGGALMLALAPGVGVGVVEWRGGQRRNRGRGGGRRP